jgi:hypothetical protein
MPSCVKRLRVGFKLFQGVLEVFWRHFDLWKGGGFELRRILIFLLCSTFGESFGVFLKPFWGHFLTIICRELSVLHLL